MKAKLEGISVEMRDLREERETLVDKVGKLEKEMGVIKKENESLVDEVGKREREGKQLEEMLARERKERSLLSVPSLEEFSSKKAEENTFNDIYSTVTKK